MQEIHGQLKTYGLHVRPFEGRGEVEVEVDELGVAIDVIVAAVQGQLLLHLVEQTYEPFKALLIPIDPEEVDTSAQKWPKSNELTFICFPTDPFTILSFKIRHAARA